MAAFVGCRKVRPLLVTQSGVFGSARRAGGCREYAGQSVPPRRAREEGSERWNVLPICPVMICHSQFSRRRAIKSRA